jgi:hypothetical protein
VNQIVKNLDVAHANACVTNKLFSYQINVLIDVDCDAFSCHASISIKLSGRATIGPVRCIGTSGLVGLITFGFRVVLYLRLSFGTGLSKVSSVENVWLLAHRLIRLTSDVSCAVIMTRIGVLQVGQFTCRSDTSSSPSPATRRRLRVQ